MSIASMFPLVPLKRLVDPSRPITYGIVQAGPDDPNGVPYIRPIDMSPERGVRLGALRRTSVQVASTYRRSAVQPNDLVVSIGPSFGKTMKVPLELDGANLTQGTARVAVKGASPDFVLWALRSNLAQQYWEAAVGGATFRALDLAELSATPVPLPEIHRQRCIERFLDEQTTTIDVLINKKERLEAVFREEWQSEMQPTLFGQWEADDLEAGEIEWLGPVPRHWRVVRAGLLFRERDDRGEPDLPQLEVSINKGVTLREFAGTRIERVASDLGHQKIARRGDLVFNKMRMWQGAVGVAPEDGLVSADYTVAVPNGEILSTYAQMVLKTQRGRTEIDKWSHGMVRDRNRLYWAGFRNIRLPVPPLEEQRRILDRIDSGSRRCDALCSKISHASARLREYRSALITAAVTGQIDVRSAA